MCEVVWQAALGLFGSSRRCHAQVSLCITGSIIIFHGLDMDMLGPVIEFAGKSDQNDIFMLRWKYGNSYNITIYPETLPAHPRYYLNEPLRWRGRERWPVEDGVVRSPEYFSQVVRQFGPYVNMVEVCFPYSGIMKEDGHGRKVSSYVEEMSEVLPETVVVGYTGGDASSLPKLLTDDLQSHPQRLIEDRNTLDRLGEIVADHYGSMSYSPIRFRNGKAMGHGSDAQQFQPYHVRAAEARAGSARAGTSSMPSGAPHASGARVGGLDAGAEHVGEGALDKWLRDLGGIS